jgi:hypothetical protein
MAKHASPQVHRNMVHKPVRTGNGASGIRGQSVGQIGIQLGGHSTEGGVVKGALERREAPAPHNAEMRLGNEVAYSTKCGVGGSPNVMKSGAQGQHGPSAPGNPPPAGSVFSKWEK